MLHVISTLGTPLLGLGYFLPLIYLGWSAFFGQVAGPNPWRATGLEWQTASPPPENNFDEPPVVTVAPYRYDLGRTQTGSKIPEERT